MKTTGTLIITFLLMIISVTMVFANNEENTVTRNGMTINWSYSGDRIFFEMQAPTQGWVAIGFNDSAEIKGTYLLMGNVINDKPQVVEHFTISPGNYKPFKTLGADNEAQDIEGFESNDRTQLKFSLPINPTNHYARNLKNGLEYNMLIAYSLDDDFTHHSIMRASIKVRL